MNSKIILVKNINLDRDYINVLDYTEEEMLALCKQNKVDEASDYSFIRTNRSIMASFTYEECLQANYIAFQNTDYSGKWFFAWIDEVNNKGNRCTELTYTIDSWSTWFDYWKAKTCFVSREHVNDDTIGNNTIEENINVGDVIEEKEIEDESLSKYYWVAVESAWQPNDNSTGNEALDKDKGEQFSGITVYNKQIFGTQVLLFKVSNISELLNLGLYIRRTNSDGHITDINNIFIVPEALLSVKDLTQHTAYMGSETLPFTFYTMPMSSEVVGFDIDINKITSFNNFVPKNNKCFVYPYNFLYLTNNAGNSNIYKYENFYNSNKAKFRLDIAMSIGVSGKITPLNYKNMSRCDDEAISLAKFPTCSWSSDAFINWLTQNAVNESIQMAFGIFGAGQQYVSSNNQKQETRQTNISAEVGLGLNLAGQIARQIGNFYSGALMPNIQGGKNTGDVNWAIGKNTYTFRCMRVKTENLKIIDDYFTRFGYQINRVKVPNLSGRRYWNYVEIGQSEEIGTGTVPTKFMVNINNAAKRGVTVWHNHENIGNFNLDNTIV